MKIGIIFNQVVEFFQDYIVSSLTSKSSNNDVIQFNDLGQILLNMPKYKTSPNFDVVLNARLKKEMREERSRKLPMRLNFSFRIPAYAGMAITFLFLGIFIGRAFSPGLPPSSMTNFESAKNTSLQIVTPSEKSEYDDASKTKMKNFVIEIASPNDLNSENPDISVASLDRNTSQLAQNTSKRINASGLNNQQHALISF